jgi:hypothetical protein
VAPSGRSGRLILLLAAGDGNASADWPTASLAAASLQICLQGNRPRCRNGASGPIPLIDTLMGHPRMPQPVQRIRIVAS